jgi:hypothetical protein
MNNHIPFPLAFRKLRIQSSDIATVMCAVDRLYFSCGFGIFFNYILPTFCCTLLKIFWKEIVNFNSKIIILVKNCANNSISWVVIFWKTIIISLSLLALQLMKYAPSLEWQHCRCCFLFYTSREIYICVLICRLMSNIF